MNDDSEEKILRDWNKMWAPDILTRAFGMAKKYQPETDFQVVYRKLKEYAQRHGKKDTLPSKEINMAQNTSFREEMKGHQKEVTSIWIRAKKLRKIKKLK